MQVINLLVTSPLVGFRRFHFENDFTVFVIGGDKTFSYVLRAYYLVKDSLNAAPKFRFVPLGRPAEVIRLVNNFVRTPRSAALLTAELPTLTQYDFSSWTVVDHEVLKYRDDLCEEFYFFFALNMETYLMEPEPEEPNIIYRFANRVKKAVVDTWYALTQRYREWRNGPEPNVADYVTIEVDGNLLDLNQRKYVSIVIANRVVCSEGPQGSVTYTSDGRVDIYGLTQYFTITRRNLKRRAYKLAETGNVKINVLQNMPFQVDGYWGTLKHITPGEPRELSIYLNPPIQVLGERENFTRSGNPITRWLLREDEDKPLETDELFINDLEPTLRSPGLERMMERVEDNDEEELRRALEDNSLGMMYLRQMVTPQERLHLNRVMRRRREIEEELLERELEEEEERLEREREEEEREEEERLEREREEEQMAIERRNAETRHRGFREIEILESITEEEEEEVEMEEAKMEEAEMEEAKMEEAEMEEAKMEEAKMEEAEMEEATGVEKEQKSNAFQAWTMECTFEDPHGEQRVKKKPKPSSTCWVLKSPSESTTDKVGLGERRKDKRSRKKKKEREAALEDVKFASSEVIKGKIAREEEKEETSRRQFLDEKAISEEETEAGAEERRKQPEVEFSSILEAEEKRPQEEVQARLLPSRKKQTVRQKMVPERKRRREEVVNRWIAGKEGRENRRKEKSKAAHRQFLEEKARREKRMAEEQITVEEEEASRRPRDTLNVEAESRPFLENEAEREGSIAKDEVEVESKTAEDEGEAVKEKKADDGGMKAEAGEEMRIEQESPQRRKAEQPKVEFRSSLEEKTSEERMADEKILQEDTEARLTPSRKKQAVRQKMITEKIVAEKTRRREELFKKYRAGKGARERRRKEESKTAHRQFLENEAEREESMAKDEKKAAERKTDEYEAEATEFKTDEAEAEAVEEKTDEDEK